MASSVEYYFQTDHPEKLANVLTEKFGWPVTLNSVDFNNWYDKPELNDYQRWYCLDTATDWKSQEHRDEVQFINECSNLIDSSFESHDSIGDSWWAIGQGLDDAN